MLVGWEDMADAALPHGSPGGRAWLAPAVDAASRRIAEKRMEISLTSLRCFCLLRNSLGPARSEAAVGRCPSDSFRFPDEVPG